MQKSKKVVILGHFGVGKTSLIRRFVSDQFSDKYKVTIGVHITKKVIELSADDSISMILWDLEGTDTLEQIRDAYLLGTHGVIFVFDISRPSTFQHLNRDLEIVAKKIPQRPLLVIGNKKDLIQEDEVDTLLDSYEITYDFLTSAKTGDTVEDAFISLATLLNNET
ncbi:MAG: GTP-binding protein [Flavobacteriaceae bacterium]|nr:GTP-binding protein [Muriicola sp.]NNC61072.1 GTP-binding protein [Eudoraea sp.]NNK21528.1 GTP-binding protein [Flavobacteriaceae bacterium]MBT8289494.1 GTP-binding protein [Muriicola sp.]NNK34686.1 GTP-binding protein [Eudoraea sp.]